MGDQWFFPRNKTHQPCIVDMMSHFHGGVECEHDHKFTREDLLEVTLGAVKHWMADKACGDPCCDIERGDGPMHA